MMSVIDGIKLHDRTWLITGNRCENHVVHLYGNISCGKFRMIDCEIEGYLEIPKAMIGSGDYFALRADGDSMVDAGIHDGDIVIVEKNPSPINGQIAVVMMEDEVVLKRFYRLEKEKKYLLHPENAKYKDIIIEQCSVLGVAIKVINNLI